MWRLFPALAVGAVVLSGCFSDERLSVAPATLDLTGSYRIAADSTSRSVSLSAAANESEIILREDGTASLRSLPTSVEGPLHIGANRLGDQVLLLNADGQVSAMPATSDFPVTAAPQVVSAEARWAVEAVDGGYGVRLDVQRGGTMVPGLKHAASTLIVGGKGAYRLKFVIGDPDAGNYTIYSRVDRTRSY